jgi:hypothetical protein
MFSMDHSWSDRMAHAAVFKIAIRLQKSEVALMVFYAILNQPVVATHRCTWCI